MHKKATPKVKQQKPSGQLIVHQIRVGLAVGVVTISLMLALGVGFLVGRWYQAREEIALYPPLSAGRSSSHRPLPVSVTPSGPKAQAVLPAGGDREARAGEGSRLASPRQTTRHEEASSARRYSIQVGSFRGRQQAEQLRDRLTHKGYPARIQTSRVSGKGIWYRVRVGYYADRTTADQMAQRLVSHEHLSVLIAPASR